MSNYFNNLRSALRSGGDPASQAASRRAERELGWRDSRSDLAERRAAREDYDRTCR